MYIYILYTHLFDVTSIRSTNSTQQTYIGSSKVTMADERVCKFRKKKIEGKKTVNKKESDRD